MEKTIAGLIGAVGALVAVAPAQAAPVAAPATVESAMQAASYRDLLKPIPNALELLNAAPEAQSEPELTQVQYYRRDDHHHHHHRYYRRRYRHHHHHHNHYGY